MIDILKTLRVIDENGLFIGECYKFVDVEGFGQYFVVGHDLPDDDLELGEGPLLDHFVDQDKVQGDLSGLFGHFLALVLGLLDKVVDELRLVCLACVF